MKRDLVSWVIRTAAFDIDIEIRTARFNVLNSCSKAKQRIKEKTVFSVGANRGRRNMLILHVREEKEKD